MQRSLIILVVFPFCSLFGQTHNNENLLVNYEQYDVVLEYNNDFNNDKIKDVLYILSSKKENNTDLINNNDSISKRKTIIYLGKTNGTYLKVFEENNLFPCRECLGKSDNYINDLKFENNILSYTTVIAPFASNNYSIIKFELKFHNYKFKIYNYCEEYFSVKNDYTAKICLKSKNFQKKYFNYYCWVSNYNWFTNVKITMENVEYLNDFALDLQKIDQFTAIEILKIIIKKFPNRTTTTLNLADNYWNIDDKAKAREYYIKYLELTKNKKDYKIPQYILERINESK